MCPNSSPPLKLAASAVIMRVSLVHMHGHSVKGTALRAPKSGRRRSTIVVAAKDMIVHCERQQLATAIAAQTPVKWKSQRENPLKLAVLAAYIKVEGSPR